MMLPWKVVLLMACMLAGCSSTSQRIPVGAGAGDRSVIHIPRTAGLQPITIEEEEFQSEVRRLARGASLKGTPREAAENTFQISPDSGNYLYLREDKKLVPMEPGEPLEGALTQEDLQTAERYRIWCQQVHHSYGDCLGGALVGGRYLDMRGRYLWAMAMSKSPVLDDRGTRGLIPRSTTGSSSGDWPGRHGPVALSRHAGLT